MRCPATQGILGLGDCLGKRVRLDNRVATDQAPLRALAEGALADHSSFESHFITGDRHGRVYSSSIIRVLRRGTVWVQVARLALAWYTPTPPPPF